VDSAPGVRRTPRAPGLSHIGVSPAERRGLQRIPASTTSSWSSRRRESWRLGRLHRSRPAWILALRAAWSSESGYAAR